MIKEHSKCSPLNLTSFLKTIAEFTFFHSLFSKYLIRCKYSARNWGREAPCLHEASLQHGSQPSMGSKLEDIWLRRRGGPWSSGQGNFHVVREAQTRPEDKDELARCRVQEQKMQSWPRFSGGTVFREWKKSSQWLVTDRHAFFYPHLYHFPFSSGERTPGLRLNWVKLTFCFHHLQSDLRQVAHSLSFRLIIGTIVIATSKLNSSH